MCCNGIIVILALIIGFAAVIYLVYQAYSYARCGCGKYGPFVSSYGQLKEDILNEAREILKKSKKTLHVTDLGCGSGALLIPLAKEFPQHRFIGLEWDIVPLTMGKIKARGLKNITFEKGDYMKTSHADMDLILCYVLKVTGEPLGKKLAEEIKDDSIVISEMFPLAHLQEIKQIQSSLFGVPEKVFVYKKKDQKKKSAVSKPDKKPTSTKKTTAAEKSSVSGKTAASKSSVKKTAGVKTGKKAAVSKTTVKKRNS